MLHIVNGDSFGARLKHTGMLGEIFVWRESLYEGPISVDLTDPDALQARSLYFEQAYGIPAQHFTEVTLRQEQFLSHVGAYDQVVLWFEHDLYDQLMLCYLLHKISAIHSPFKGNHKLYMLCIGEFPGIELFQGLGQLAPEQVATLEGQWTEVTQDQLNLGSVAWQAYASSQPSSIAALMHGDCSVLPYLRAALVQHLGRFPSVHNGLNQNQAATLKLIRKGDTSVLKLFHRMGQMDSGFGLGDLQFWRLIEDMRACQHPLVSLVGGQRLPRFNEQLPIDFGEWKLCLTEAGSQVLNGELDHIKLNGIDSWIGGVHMNESLPIWRWDANNKSLLVVE